MQLPKYDAYLLDFPQQTATVILLWVHEVCDSCKFGGLILKEKLTLVTGATGFVGSELVSRLIRDGINTRACVRHANVVLPNEAHVVQVGDMTGDVDWRHILKDVGDVVHAAARVHVMNDTATDPLVEFRSVNVLGTLNLARQAATAGVRRFLFISSVKVNGEVTELNSPFFAEDTPAPLDPYGVSKMEAENGLRTIATETGMDVVIIRPPLVYGPGVKANFEALMRAVRHRWPLPLGSVDNQRSLVALDNLVDFIVTCITHPQAVNQTFLVSDGHDLSTTELVRGMAQAAGVPARLLPVPVWALQAGANLLGKGDAVQRLCGNLQVDISKARTLLGWVPPVSVEEGLRRAMGAGLPRYARNDGINSAQRPT